MVTYASAAREQPARLGDEALHVGKALLPEVERHVDDVCHKAKCCKTLSEEKTHFAESNSEISYICVDESASQNKNDTSFSPI